MLVHNVCSGQWTNVNESMSPNSRVYQEAITGASNMSYVQNGVKFDGMIDDVLIECKAGYSQFINKKTGEFFSWFNGKQGFIDQALRQLNASGGNKIKAIPHGLSTSKQTIKRKQKIKPYQDKRYRAYT